jgi:hypothetical protein
MYNLVKAAEAGWKGSVAEALDFELAWQGGLPQDQPAPVPCERVPCAGNP